MICCLYAQAPNFRGSEIYDIIIHSFVSINTILQMLSNQWLMKLETSQTSTHRQWGFPCQLPLLSVFSFTDGTSSLNKQTPLAATYTMLHRCMLQIIHLVPFLLHTLVFRKSGTRRMLEGVDLSGCKGLFLCQRNNSTVIQFHGPLTFFIPEQFKCSCKCYI